MFQRPDGLMPRPCDLRLLSVLLLLTMPACSPVTEMMTDGDLSAFSEIQAEGYTPPSGVADYVPSESDGPGPRRIMLATSVDGVTYSRTNTVLSDQANTPNMLVLPNGRIIIYYTAYKLDGGVMDGIGAAVSDDLGATWEYYKVELTGFPDDHAPIGDPDVIREDDGTYRMFVTNGTEDGSEIQIVSTTSTDGFSFEKEGIALDLNSTNYKDSLTYKLNDGYVMFVLASNGTMMNRAVSSDGQTFVSEGDWSFTQEGTPYVLSNWFDDGSGTLRIFAFGPPNQSDIRSFTTVDGKTLTADPNVFLLFNSEEPTEKSWVKDAAVGKLPDGTHLMAYVTEIP